jgi:hypothetical protein
MRVFVRYVVAVVTIDIERPFALIEVTGTGIEPIFLVPAHLEAGLQATSTVLAQRMSRVVEARPYLERGAAAKHVTSQLALLTEEGYVEGMASVWSDVRRAEAQGSALTLRADLHIYATPARVPEYGGLAIVARLILGKERSRYEQERV